MHGVRTVDERGAIIPDCGRPAAAGSASSRPGVAPRNAGAPGLLTAVVGLGALSSVYGIGVGHLADGSVVPMATAIASAGLAAVVAFALLRRRG